MIVWSNKGFLVGAFVFGCSLAANLLTNVLTGSEEYWEIHKWPFGLSLIFSGLITWTVGNALNDAGSRTLQDQQTGEEIILAPGHTFFYIKMHWWGAIITITGIITLALDFVK